MSVKGLVENGDFALKPVSSVLDACKLMHQEKIGAVSVLDDGELVGIFTYRDLLGRVILQNRALAETSLGEVMTTDVDKLATDATYGDALRVMVEGDYTYLPVVRESGEVAGMLSLRGVLQHRIDHLAGELDTVTKYFAVDGPGGD